MGFIFLGSDGVYSCIHMWKDVYCRRDERVLFVIVVYKKTDNYEIIIVIYGVIGAIFQKLS